MNEVMQRALVFAAEISVNLLPLLKLGCGRITDGNESIFHGVKGKKKVPVFLLKCLWIFLDAVGLQM